MKRGEIVLGLLIGGAVGIAVAAAGTYAVLALHGTLRERYEAAMGEWCYEVDD